MQDEAEDKLKEAITLAVTSITKKLEDTGFKLKAEIHLTVSISGQEPEKDNK